MTENAASRPTPTWSLWTEEIHGVFHRTVVSEQKCPQTLKMLTLMAETCDSESYALVTGLSDADVQYLNDTKPVRFVTSDSSDVGLTL